MKFNYSKLSAFTMAEAILVMTILGIIATIMISTLKPSQFKDRALRILAKKSIGQVESVLTQLTLNHSRSDSLSELYKLDSDEIFSLHQNPAEARKLLMKYLKYKRDEKLAVCTLGAATEITKNTDGEDENEEIFKLAVFP